MLYLKSQSRSWVRLKENLWLDGGDMAMLIASVSGWSEIRELQHIYLDHS